MPANLSQTLTVASLSPPAVPLEAARVFHDELLVSALRTGAGLFAVWSAHSAAHFEGLVSAQSLNRIGFNNGVVALHRSLVRCPLCTARAQRGPNADTRIAGAL